MKSSVGVFVVTKLVLLLSLFGFGGSDTSVLDSMIDESYDGRTRPGSQGNPTEIQVSVKIDAVENLDLVNHEVSLTVEIVEVWNDPRLDARSAEEIRTGSNNTKDRSDKVAIDDTGRLWMPSLYLSNVRGDLSDTRVVKVDGHLGQVTKLTKVRIVVGCPLEFFYFPWDKQTCEFKISSLEHSKDEVLFLWKEDGKSLSVSKSVPHTQLYVLKGFALSNDTSEGILGEHSELGVKLLFARQKMRSFPFYYFPPLALCVTAFFSLWMTVSPLPIYISLISFVAGILHYILVEDLLPTHVEMGMYDHYVFLCVNLILNCVIVNILMYGFLNPSGRIRKTLSIVGRSPNGKVEMKTFNGIPPGSPSTGDRPNKPETPDTPAESFSPEELIYRMSKFKRFVYFKGCKPAKLQLPICFAAINVIYWCWILIATLRFPSGFQRFPPG